MQTSYIIFIDNIVNVIEINWPLEIKNKKNLYIFLEALKIFSIVGRNKQAACLNSGQLKLDSRQKTLACCLMSKVCLRVLKI